VILTDEEKMILTPTYHVMEMYNVHQNALMLPLTVTSNDYVLGDRKLTAVSASASKDKNGAINISLVNIDASKEQKITISLGDINNRKISGRILSSPKIQDHNSFEKPENIIPKAFNNVKVKGSEMEVTLPPFSVVVLKLS
ncbi:MAG: alpha-N-arabinofuranosidase, partial [Chitinophagaceae bacterium]